MKSRYEYKFVRLGEGWWSLRKAAETDYQSVIHEHAADGWRLVQVFAPSKGLYGHSTYYELIFERQMASADS